MPPSIRGCGHEQVQPQPLGQELGDPRQWNLFVSVRAFALLTYGYPGVRRRFEERLAALEATVAAASVNRVDVACDLDAPGFEPEPDCFVAPAHTQSRSYHPGEGVRAAEVVAHRRARRVSGVTVGHMPGRQLCLYDKRADSLAKSKRYWAPVWRIDLAEHREPIWRAEVRAGRDELARHLPIRSFEHLEAGLADIVASILTKLRYVLPSPTDLNRARWPTHPLWDVASRHLLATIEGQAFAPAPPRRDLPTPVAIKRDMLERQLIGLARSYGALAGVAEGHAGEIGDLVGALLAEWRKRPDKAEEDLARARARYGIFG